MTFDPIRAAIRFGTGLSPKFDPPTSVGRLMDMARNETVDRDFPIAKFDKITPLNATRRDLMSEFRRVVREKDNTPHGKAIVAEWGDVNGRLREYRFEALRNTVARGVFARHGLRERLVMFWADHFTAGSKGYPRGTYYGDYLDAAIRPHVLGKFKDMLRAVVTHPLMIHYLDQASSTGPNSDIGRENPGRGLNENMARELLELHTLGVDGPYTQDDVKNLARILTGLSEGLGLGFVWNVHLAEPGRLRILDRTYGSDTPVIEDVYAVLDDLARHPATADHLAYKLVQHFISDTPNPGLVNEMAGVFRDTDGDLDRVMEFLISHDASWGADTGNVKLPLEYMISALRSLNLPPTVFRKMGIKKTKELFFTPLTQMGQAWISASGPDGFPEEDDRWISPQGLAARLEWAIQGPAMIMRRTLDPRDVLPDALGPLAPESLKFAVHASEQRHEGLALIFVSPAFQRR